MARGSGCGLHTQFLAATQEIIPVALTFSENVAIDSQLAFALGIVVADHLLNLLLVGLRAHKSGCQWVGGSGSLWPEKCGKMLLEVEISLLFGTEIPDGLLMFARLVGKTAVEAVSAHSGKISTLD